MDEHVVRLCGSSINLCVPFGDNPGLHEKQLKWFNTQSVIQFTASAKEIFLEKDVDAVGFCDDTHYAFYILHKETNEIIGMCSITLSLNQRNAMLNIIIGEETYNTIDIGTEIIAVLVKYCFEELNMHNVVVLVNSNDIVHMKSMANCRFSVAGIEKETAFVSGKWTDTITMQLLEQEYFSNVDTSNMLLSKDIVNMKSAGDDDMVNFIYGEANVGKEQLLREQILKQSRENEHIDINVNWH